MRPAMQRRRRHLLTRRQDRRGNQHRGVLIALVAVLALFVVLVGGTVLGAGGTALVAYNYFAAGLPDPHLLDDVPLPQSTFVYDRSGKVLLARFECQNRDTVTFDQLPEVIVDATVASEDQTFWTNNGVDFAGIGRAALANLRAGRIVQGASTITQQVIKYAGSIKMAQQEAADASAAASAPAASQPAAGLSDEEICPAPELTFLEGRGFEDKIREQIMAMRVTAAYPGREGKERILATYLNLIYYGNGSYGIKAAAANYFGISDLSQLSLAQAAFLSGLPQRPSGLDPYQPFDHPRGPEPAMAERDGVLGRMYVEGYITPQAYQEGLATTWEQMGPSRVENPLLEPHFTFRVQREVVRVLQALGVPNPEQALRTGGYRITTTLDYGLQQAAHKLMTKWVKALKYRNVHNGALVAIDSATGEIVAYLGSVDYYNREDPRVQGQFDVAGLGRRQPGSSFKPYVYTSAFVSRRATVATMLMDSNTDFNFGRGEYTPSDADGNERGPVLSVDAIHYSLNIPAIQMEWIVGPETTARLAESMGVASADYIMAQDPGLTLGIGTVPISLANHTVGFSVFAQQGTLHPATTLLQIRDRDGNLIYSRQANGPTASQPLTKAEAYLMHWMIEGNTNPRINLWWGRRAELFTPDGRRRHAAFKTGTTDDFIDVWAMGYIPNSLSVGVWMGNNNQDPLFGLLAADGPEHLWHDFMDTAINDPWDWNGHEAVPASDFKRPNGVVMAEVCAFSGMAPTPECGPTKSLPFLEGTVPPPDNVHHSDQWHPQGCFDVVQYVEQNGRPENFAKGAADWADRFNNGKQAAQRGASIVQLPGRSGFGAPICGEDKNAPTPNPSDCLGNPHECTPPQFTCPPFPSPCLTLPLSGSISSGAPVDVGILVPLFGLPFLLGLAPHLVRLVRRRR